MSYDIGLYRRDFLKRAIENKLDDWLGADPIPEQTIQAVLEAAKVEGFVERPLKQPRGATTTTRTFACRAELMKRTPTLLAQLHVFAGQIAFTIPYGPLARDSVPFCTRLAKEIARTHGLGYRDPQTGEALYD
jgi:hypothetical protein